MSTDDPIIRPDKVNDTVKLMASQIAAGLSPRAPEEWTVPELPCGQLHHVPGHTPGCPRANVTSVTSAPDAALEADLAAVADRLGDAARAEAEAFLGLETPDPRSPAVTSVTSVTRGLRVTLVVEVTRAGRRRCPKCRLVRVLIRQTAFAADQPVGYGEARCYQCAGLRNG